MFLLFIFSIVLYILHIIIFTWFYEVKPESVIGFFNYLTNTIISREKAYISIFKFPIIGFLITAFCIIMYKINISDKNKKYNKIIWSVIPLIVSLMMLVRPTEILFFNNSTLVFISSLIIMICVIICIILLVYSVIKILLNEVNYIEYKNGVNNKKINLIIILLSLFLVMIFIPNYIK